MGDPAASEVDRREHRLRPQLATVTCSLASGAALVSAQSAGWFVPRGGPQGPELARFASTARRALGGPMSVGHATHGHRDGRECRRLVGYLPRPGANSHVGRSASRALFDFKDLRRSEETTSGITSI